MTLNMISLMNTGLFEFMFRYIINLCLLMISAAVVSAYKDIYDSVETQHFVMRRAYLKVLMFIAVVLVLVNFKITL